MYLAAGWNVRVRGTGFLLQVGWVGWTMLQIRSVDFLDCVSLER